MATNDEMLSARARPSDIISNLPDNIIESILMCLPTRDALRTSILSKTWRYRWAKLPRLILDKMFWTKSARKHKDMRIVAAILNQILLFHEGPIKKITLYLPGRGDCPEIDNLILFLSRKSVEDFELIRASNKRYRLPLLFFTCQQMRHLSLKYCLIDAPPAFKGFSRLITLKLSQVTITGKLLESLISSSPFLELLELLDIPLFEDLAVEVDAPNMKIIRYLGDANMFIFKNVPRLSVVSYLPSHYSEVSVGRAATYNLYKFFNDLPSIKKLYLSFTFVELLVEAGVPSKLLTTLVHLQELELDEIELGRFNVLPFILCLLSSSPNLNTMKIKFDVPSEAEFDAPLWLLKEQRYSDVMLNQLKMVEMRAAGAISEAELIKFLLAKSPNLKQIQVYEHVKDNIWEIFEELSHVPRASMEAEVICETYGYN